MINNALRLFTLLAMISTLLAAQPAGPVERLTDRFEQTKDIAVVYHLARVTFALKKHDQAQKWLSLLKQSDWKMGIDDADFSAADTTPEILALLADIKSMQLPQSGKSVISSTLTIDDPLLIPENITYDSVRGVLYAGSLVEPRIARVDLNNASMNDNLPLPVNVNWGVVYGMKYHERRKELWVLHNRRNAGRLHGALSVVNGNGQFIKTYMTPNQSPIEFNDLCFTETDVYVTDSGSSKIYKGAINGDNLSVFYQDADMSYPNGIACNEKRGDVFVSDSRGISIIDVANPVSHVRLQGEKGVSFGGIDGLYLEGELLVGVQNFLGAPKIVITNIAAAPKAAQTRLFDVNREEFRIPTTGFLHNGCLHYIANSSLDAIRPDGTIDPTVVQPKPAKVMVLNFLPAQKQCLLITRSVASDFSDSVSVLGLR